MLSRHVRRILGLPRHLRVRATGAIVGNSVHFAQGGRCVVAHGAKIIIENGVSFHKDFLLRAEAHAQIYIGEGVSFGERARLTTGPQGKIVIGSGSWFNHDCVLDAQAAITIGEKCLFGPYSYIVDNNHQTGKGKGIIAQGFDAEPLSIGDDVWLGVGATLLMGCQIGNGAVVAARAVVNKPIPDYEIWGGIPAKRLGQRSVNSNERPFSTNIELTSVME